MSYMAMLESLQEMEMLKKEQQTQKLADDSIPGIYERYMNDILEYLRKKFPQLNDAELMEATGFISSRSMVMVQDTLIERDNLWHKETSRMRKAYERELKKIHIKKEEYDINDEELKRHLGILIKEV